MIQKIPEEISIKEFRDNLSNVLHQVEILEQSVKVINKRTKKVVCKVFPYREKKSIPKKITKK